MSSSRDALRTRYDRATADLDPPFAIVDLDAFDANSAAMLGRAAGKPLRVPSKSVRVRALIDRALAQPGWRGVMAYTLPEAIWLAGQGTSGDILVAYPTADRAALHRLATDEKLAATVTVMVDSTAQLDLIDAVVPAGERAGAVRVCIDLDGSWRPARGVHIGVRRSPVHSPRQAGDLAAAIAGRAGFRLVGLMCYEAQIAGLGDAPPGRPVRGALIRAIQSRSFPELTARRSAVVAEVRRHAELEFVNGGGTGSVQATAQDPAVTEVAAGSGLFGPWLFDGYRRWRPQPAAFFAMSVVRRPNPQVATVLGGGWIASGETSPTRQPLPWLPEGLKLIGTEGAGEVQTPLVGPGAAGLRLGDRVYFRHAKAGELCEHVNEVHLVSGDTIVDVVPTYRGEGKVFL
ncbi:amino acid deaminase/aldolase [Dactylosporangium sp. NPDC050688]|uniref:amino acid deaminase/aldolase n=1 Tax=Dactylosporangium sp. NPDC050688 TaxID=3157217 RepID=UPI0033FC3E19